MIDAVGRLIDFLSTETENAKKIPATLYFKQDSRKKLKIVLDVTLDQKDLEELLESYMFLDLNKEQGENFYAFAKNLKLVVKMTRGSTSALANLNGIIMNGGDFQSLFDRGLKDLEKSEEISTRVSKIDIRDHIGVVRSPLKNFEFIKKLAQDNFSKPYSLNLGGNHVKAFAKFVREKLYTLRETRARPQKIHWGGHKNFQCGELPGFLYSLKNSKTYEDQQVFRKIVETFEEFQPDLKPMISSEGTPELIFRDSSLNIDISSDEIGFGILNAFTILSLIVSKRDHVFFLDEPELNMHPQLQKRTFNTIQKYCNENDNQCILVTHSPYFTDFNDVEIIKLSRDAGITKLNKVSLQLDQTEREKIIETIGVENKEMLFASKVLLVEGSSEKTTMPIFFPEMFKFGEVSIISTGGKGNTDIFIKILNNLNIPFVVLYDKDAEKALLDLKAELGIDFEIIKQPYEDFTNLLEKEYPQLVSGCKKSKPQKSRCIANKAVTQGLDPPKLLEELKETLKDLTQRTTK